MITNTEDFMMQILHCGISDLDLIEGVNYDWYDIIDTDSTFRFNLNAVMSDVFAFGYSQIEQAVNNRIEELEFLKKKGVIEEDEEVELSELKELEPMEDFSSFHNYLDTHVWCERNASIYQKYMQDALGDFAEGTGFEIALD